MKRRTPIRQLLTALSDAYPEGDIPGSYWLGNGYLCLVPTRSALELDGIWVAPNRRGGGHGTLMLDTLTALADRYGVTLKARVLPFGPGKKPPAAVLRAWYARWGFSAPRKGALYLTRTPRVSESSAPGP